MLNWAYSPFASCSPYMKDIGFLCYRPYVGGSLMKKGLKKSREPSVFPQKYMRDKLCELGVAKNMVVRLSAHEGFAVPPALLICKNFCKRW